MVDSAFFVKSRNQLLLELSLDLFNTLQIFTLVNLFLLFSMLGVGGKGGGVGLSSKSYLLPSFISSVLFLSKHFCHSFLRNCAAYKVETLYTFVQWVAGIRLLLVLIHPFIHFTFSPVLNLNILITLFSGTLYTFVQWVAGIRLLLVLIHPFIHFTFSPVLNLNILITLFSGTMRPTKLEFGTHMTSRWMYHVYRSQAAVVPLFSFFLPILFSALFSGIVTCTKLKLGIHGDNGLMYCVYLNQTTAAYVSLYFFIFLSLQFSHVKIFCHI